MKDEMNDPGNTQRAHFERALRARYAEAATHLSARTQAQLHTRLQAVVAEGSRAASRRPGWLLATATAFSLALIAVFGLQWRPGAESMPPATPTPALAPNGASNEGELVATLDETPDLYLWLASDDANTLTTE